MKACASMKHIIYEIRFDTLDAQIPITIAMTNKIAIERAIIFTYLSIALID
jgi:hypothetical protein